MTAVTAIFLKQGKRGMDDDSLNSVIDDMHIGERMDDDVAVDFGCDLDLGMVPKMTKRDVLAAAVASEKARMVALEANNRDPNKTKTITVKSLFGQSIDVKVALTDKVETVLPLVGAWSMASVLVLQGQRYPGNTILGLIPDMREGAVFYLVNL